MTFSLPKDLAQRLVRRIPARNRSRYLVRLLEKSFREEEEALIQSCRLANQDPEVKTIEEEFDQVPGAIEEPWDDAASR